MSMSEEQAEQQAMEVIEHVQWGPNDEFSTPSEDDSPGPVLTKSKKKRIRLRARRNRERLEAAAAIASETKDAQIELVVDLSKPCLFLTVLTRDIRQMIYDLLFARPIGIRPTVNFYRRRHYVDRVLQDTTKYSNYRYQWAGQYQELPQWSDYNLPSRNSNILDVHVDLGGIRPSEKQEKLMEEGKRLPDVEDLDEDYSTSKVRHNYYHDGSGELRIDTYKTYYLAGFFGVKLLRTCKQIHDEAADTLYGKNLYVFNNLARYAYRPENLSDYLPTVSHLKGVAQSEETDLQNVKRLLDNTTRQPEEIWNDEMLKFFNRIGPQNGARVRLIKMTGCLSKSYNRNYGSSAETFQGMASYMPVYSFVLKNTCPALRKVYLEINNVPASEWNESTNEEEEAQWQANHSLLYNTVGNFVKGLPQLEELHLGWSINLHGKREVIWNEEHWKSEENKWKDTLYWPNFVRNRMENAKSIQSVYQSLDWSCWKPEIESRVGNNNGSIAEN